MNRKLGRVSFVKELESGRILNEKRKKGRGLCKSTCLLPPLSRETGEGRCDAGGTWAGGSGRDGGHGVGEKREGGSWG